MNELIEVREESGKQLVSARELYLGWGWIERIGLSGQLET